LYLSFADLFLHLFVSGLLFIFYSFFAVVFAGNPKSAKQEKEEKALAKLQKEADDFFNSGKVAKQPRRQRQPKQPKPPKQPPKKRTRRLDGEGEQRKPFILFSNFPLLRRNS
jgi:hypothetical protein